jgi:hypothetical protein
VDRHAPIWHIVRDARQEVALWRTVRRRAHAATAGNAPSTDAVRSLALAEATVGPADGHDLPLRPERRPFRSLLRVAGESDEGPPSLRTFADVHRRLLGLAAALPEVGPDGAEPGQAYWDGIPLHKDGRVRWAIVADDGPGVWNRGIDLQAAIRDATGQTVPVIRAFPDVETDVLLLLVWVMGGAVPEGEWPDPVLAELARTTGASLAFVRPEGGPPVAIVGEEIDLDALARSLQPAPTPYPTARHMR